VFAAAIVLWKFSPHEEVFPQSTTPESAVAQKLNTVPSPSGASVLDPVPQPDRHEADSAYEMVLGIQVRKDRNCTVEIRHIVDPETSDIRQAYACTPDSSPEIDPYTTYPEETLAGMAYGDAHAAEVLGLRKLVSTDPAQEAEGLKLLLRSVALSNDTRGIGLAVNTRYSHISSEDRVELNNVRQLLVLGHIANLIKPGSMSTHHYTRLLIENGVDVEEIEQLGQQSNSILSELAGIQTEITGNTNIREALEDA